MTQTTDIVRHDDGYEHARITARDNVCGNCGRELVVKWFSSAIGWQAVCLQVQCEGAGIKSRQQVHADEIRERLERNPELARSMVSVRDVPLTTQAIRELDNEKLLARIPARYGGAIEVTKEQRLQLAQLARVYGLDPLWDLMIYEGRPYVTYDGRLRKLREHPDYRGHKVRPLTREEKDQWGYEPADLVIQCDVDMGLHGSISDWGIVRATEVKAALDKAQKDGKRPAPVGSHPQQIAIKRAVSRASKQAAGIDLPTVIESSGRIIDVQEVHRSAQAASANPEEQSRRRFWAIARGSPPDGLGLGDGEIHELLHVESLSGYPGGWDQALSDLTERAADLNGPADEVEDNPASVAAQGEPEASEEVANPPASSDAPAVDDPAEVEEALAKNGALVEDARGLGVKGLGPLTAKTGWPLSKIEEASAELSARIRSRNGELDAEISSAAQARAF